MKFKATWSSEYFFNKPTRFIGSNNNNGVHNRYITKVQSV